MNLLKTVSLFIFIGLFLYGQPIEAQKSTSSFQGSLSYVANMQIHNDEAVNLSGNLNLKKNNTWIFAETVFEYMGKAMVFINTKENMIYDFFTLSDEIFYIADSLGNTTSPTDLFIFSGFFYNGKTWKKSGKKQKIQGRKCSEYIISDEALSKETGMQYKVYVDEKATEPENFYSNTSDIKGLPVKIELVSNGFNLYFLLDQVENRIISDQELNLPKASEIISRADFMEITAKAKH